MTQRTFFTKEMVIEAAFALTREEGWKSVTTRNIAKRLGSSTMPIYSSLKSIEEIEGEVRHKAEKLMIEYQQKPFTENPSLNMAVGYVTFAKDERNLFRFLFEERPLPNPHAHTERDLDDTLEEIQSGRYVTPLADQVPVAMQDPRILKSWVFTHGLASMISSGVLDLPEEKIKGLLMDAGMAFFPSEQQPKKGEQQ